MLCKYITINIDGLQEKILIFLIFYCMIRMEMSVLERVLTSGALVNFILVIIGGSIGMLVKSGIPERIRDALMKGMALCVLYIGVTGLFEDNINPIIIVLSLGLGAALGELCDLDKQINCFAGFIERKISKGAANATVAEGFVSATLLFCVGAMTVVGSIDSGISGDNTTLYSKSIIDCISASVLASSLGLGVVLSALPVLAIEGVLTLLAAVVAPVLTTEVIAHMSVIGSLLIIAISFNMLKITKIKVMNILPAVFIPLALCFVL